VNEIELFLTELLGSYKKRTLPVNGKYHRITSYSLPMINCPTIDMVIISPFMFDTLTNTFFKNDDNSFYFFLYDHETDIIIGDIVSVYCAWDWKEELAYYCYTSEERLEENECPICNFWLVQRTNKNGHNFLGCCGFPECEFSKEISYT
jgi:hypothetical protein